MNASEKIVAERYEADGYTVIKDGMPDLTAIKEHEDHWEMIVDEVKTNRLPLQMNQKRAIALFKKMEGKPVYITVRRSRVLTKSIQPNPFQPRPVHPTPAHASPGHSKPRQSVPNHARPFTLDFLRLASREAETLDEFIVELRNYKEIKPLAHTGPIQPRLNHPTPFHARPCQPRPTYSKPGQTISGGGELDEM